MATLLLPQLCALHLKTFGSITCNNETRAQATSWKFRVRIRGLSLGTVRVVELPQLGETCKRNALTN